MIAQCETQPFSVSLSSSSRPPLGAARVCGILLDTHRRLDLEFFVQRTLGVRMAKNDLQGTLDLLVLKTLEHNGALHGYGIVLHIQSASNEMLRVEEGSLYPALHRMEQSGWISSEWAMTETNRRAKYYKLTSQGRRQLETAQESFDQLVRGVRAVLRYA